VAQIINEKRLTFIGPTTGIMGLFHGAWWYYLLLIPYVIFSGWPTGFYIFMFLISLLFNLLFFNFIKKKFGFLTGIFFLMLVSISPYFIPLAFFASNNIIVPDLIICLIILTFSLFDKKNSNKYLFLLLGLNLSFILEFEVAFGLFIIPAYLLSTLLFSSIRKRLFQLKNLILLFIGLFIPVIPRLLFEIKNHFLQSKTAIGFFTNPKLHNPKPFLIVLSDRLILFWDYFISIFYDKNILITIITTLLVIITIFVFRKKILKIKTVLFLVFITALLFVFSLFYSDNFWANYYEGIQYIFLTLIVVAFYLLSKYKKLMAIFIIMILFIINILAFYKDIKYSKHPLIGLKESEMTINYLASLVKKENYCLKIYTPPAIPFTYNYLINYQISKIGLKYPSVDPISNRCYYIIEKDDYLFRVNKWKEENIPVYAKLELRKIISDNVTVEIWKKI